MKNKLLVMLILFTIQIGSLYAQDTDSLSPIGEFKNPMIYRLEAEDNFVFVGSDYGVKSMRWQSQAARRSEEKELKAL